MWLAISSFDEVTPVALHLFDDNFCILQVLRMSNCADKPFRTR
jgi:hypothetical protein